MNRKEFWKARSEWRQKMEYAWKRQGINGATLEQYDQLFKDQGGVCAICGSPPKGTMKLMLDHHMETGTIRGLLCLKCSQNVGILEGWIQFDPSFPEMLMGYLDRPFPKLLPYKQTEPRPIIEERKRDIMRKIIKMQSNNPERSLNDIVREVSEMEELHPRTIWRYLKVSR